jgi:vancomycin resistance protein YoaR
MGSVAASSRTVISARATSRRRVARIALVAAGSLVLLVFALAVAERIVYAGDVMPGVDVPGVEVAGKSEAAAYADIRALAQQLEAEPLRAKLGDRDVQADASAFHLDVDEVATLQAAREAGRSGNPVEQTLGTALRRFRPDDVPLQVTYNDAGLDGILDGWAREAAAGGVEGDLRFEGTTVVEVEPRGGTGLLRDEAEALLVAELHSAGRDTIELPIGDIDPQVTREEVARAAAEARELLTGNHELVTDTATVPITPEQLAPALRTKIEDHRLELVTDPDALRASLGAALSAIERAPADAGFRVTEANTVEVIPSTNGLQVDLAQVGEQIIDGNRRIAAPLTEVVPAHDTAWAQGLGIKEQVSTFTTRHNSGEARVENIHRGADLINNLVVEPGQTFSLNEALGPRTIERGFVVAPVFYGEFTEDVGGGVSQLATTFFNAVFWGGYEDVYHKPHTIYISRYPMGREATLNYGTVDLQFRNNSDAGVLIRTAYSSSSITVSFYGDKEGKVVREEGRRVLGETPIENQNVECPGPSGLDTANLCAGLPAGQTRLAERGHAGIEVEFYRVIEQPGKEPVRERFSWKYRMFPNKYLVGVAPPAPPPTTAPPVPPPTDPTTPTTVAPPPPPAAPTP